jgi:LysM repeat protein
MMKKALLALVLALTVLLAFAMPAFADTEYFVQPGDTLSAIARRYDTTVTAIAQANNILNPNLIFVGQRLIIPTDGGEPPPPAPPPSASTTYVVQPGDTLFRIAVRFDVTVQALAQANNIGNINLIYVGQVLTIPGGGAPPPPPPAPPPPPPPPGSGGGFAIGGQTQTFGHANLMNQSGMTWVKFQHKWAPGDDPGALAGMIATGHGAGFKVLYSITGANTYPAANSIDFSAFVDFLRGVASLSDPPDAIEVWNEMNIDFEWPAGQIDPSSYVNNMLRPAYQAIKAANGNVLVISGAPAPTGFDNGTNAWADDRYIAGMAAAGAASYMDCVGVHHNAGATAPSATTGHPGGSHYSWYYLATRDLYYNAFGGARPVCFTELGYLTGDGFNSLPANFAWASETSLTEHAQWLAEAVQLSRDSGRVRLLIIFNVDFTLYNPTGDPQAGYAMLRPDGSCPACATVGAVMGN